MTPAKSEPIISISIGLKKMSATIQADEKSQPQQIKSYNGKTFIPPYISFVTKTARIGDGALADYQSHPKYVVYDILKLVGKSYNEVEKDEDWGFELEKNKKSRIFDVIFETSNGKRAANPVILLSLLFKSMLQMVEKQHGKAVKVAKINLGNVNDPSIKGAVEEAAYIAGFTAVF
uniref:Uncharacterized protein n=1 Tax=Panagrolaimus superbus TaxID=310955 RepID=A0A914YDS0_9BILA